MTKPTKAQIDKMKVDIVADLHTINEHLDQTDPAVDAAFASVLTFTALALRVFAKTNHSKLADEFRTVEIQARLGGKRVLDV